MFYYFMLILFFFQITAGPNLEPFLLFRIVEVLHSAYKAGRIQIADHISFFITLLSRYKIFPGTSADNFFHTHPTSGSNY